MGSCVGWLIWGVLKNDFSVDGFWPLLIGLIIGFQTGRQSK